MNQTPHHGQVVTFSKVPSGSYASPGVRYRIERPSGKGAFRMVNVERGSSTIDPAWAFKAAIWSVED